MDHFQQQRRKVHPKENANIFSLLTFLYTIELFMKGYKKPLEEKNLYSVLSKLKTKKVGDRLEIEWENQIKRNMGLSVVRLCWSVYGTKYLLVGIIQLIVEVVMLIVHPTALSKLVSYFNEGQTELTISDAYFYACVVVALNLFNCLYIHNYHLFVAEIGLEMKTALASLIYRKSLKLSPSRLEDISIGKIVTLMTKDVASFGKFLHFGNDLWIAFVKTGVLCYIIYNKTGIATFAGVGFFFVVMPLQLYMGSLSTKLRMKMSRQTDERLKFTQEAFSAIRIIKIYTWELFFENRIIGSRRKELRKMHQNFYLRYFVLIISGLNSKIAFYLLIVTYIWLGNNITAEVVFFLTSCFHTLTYTLSVMFPLAMVQLAEVIASIKRLGSVLKAMEVQPIQQDELEVFQPKVTLRNVTVEYKGRNIIQGVNLNLEMGLNLLTGPVGCGKSFLLKTILQDYETKSGKLTTCGSISYAPQEPWLFPSSIKQNIIFGDEYDERRYNEVIRVCALLYDFQLLSHGDSTIVEDRGSNLSKGQQARINLARAVYKNADIYLLDDCLAALDAHVTDYIFIECVKKFLANKLVLLVTHNLNHARAADFVILMGQGTIKSVIKPYELSLDDIREIKNITDTHDDEQESHDKIDESSRLLTEATTERKIYHEDKKSGTVEWAVYRKYFKYGGGVFAGILIALTFGCFQFTSSAADKLISKWVDTEERLSNYSTRNHSSNDSFMSEDLLNSTNYKETLAERDKFLSLYTYLIISSTVLNVLKCVCFYTVAKRSSIKLHNEMITKIINATMAFFDSNFLGNILNRFSKDMSCVDEILPFAFYNLLGVFFVTVGVVSLIATVNSIFLIPTGIVFAILVLVRSVYIRSARDLKRLDATTRSPIVGYLNASFEGLTTIRAFKTESILRDEFDKHQDLFTSANYMFNSSLRAFAFFLDVLCASYVTIIVARFVIFNDGTKAGDVGLAITQAFMLTGTLQHGIRQWAEVESQMTSVERAVEYTEIKQENQTGLVLKNWPSKGEIVYKNIFLSYNNTNEYVLKNLNFTIKPQEKIGVVGRTGAGKSSIISTLFRLYEVKGNILIDNVDAKTLTLSFLRNSISIIPQEPVLFAGTVRDNIDPMGTYTDEKIWQSIETANLKTNIPSLDFKVTEGGSNFSVGQRQLICLARAVIRNNKIIVLDEATANMDRETDELIHKTVKDNFEHCTVIIIAHKLQTILNSDKVMVLDKGEIIEYDAPDKLLNNVEGAFYKMVEKAGLRSDT